MSKTEGLIATGNFFAALKQGLRDQGLPIRPDTRLPLPPVSDGAMAACRSAMREYASPFRE